LFATERYDLVIPCEERSLLPLVVHGAELNPLSALAVPDAAARDAFFDKNRTRELATTLGIPVAQGRLLRETDTPGTIAAELGMPLIAKPKKSFSWPEIYVRKSARLIDDQAGLARLIAENAGKAEEVLLERIFQGVGLGVSVLCRDGRVLQAFEHHRAHELFGSSFYRRSAELDPARLAAVKAMVERVGYTGLAMFEFKLNTASGEWILLEVNARPWGSLPLPVSLGVDFPHGLYRVMVKGEDPAEVAYPAERYARNFIPDLWQMRSVAAEMSTRPLALAGQLLHWGWGFHRRLLGTESLDVNVRDDREPARIEFRQFIRERFDSAFHRFRRAPDITGLAKRFDALTMAADQTNVLFICQGNICRSPYAEQRLRQVLGADSSIQITSAGMLPRNRRPSPAYAREAAGARSVDLAAHLSQYASREQVDAATVILAFDEINLRSFAARYPDQTGKLCLLGLFRKEAWQEIQDPDGRGAQVFARVYQQIDDSLAQLAARLQKPASGKRHVS
jgi:protein-tyrosine-phosphatase